MSDSGSHPGDAPDGSEPPYGQPADPYGRPPDPYGQPPAYGSSNAPPPPPPQPGYGGGYGQPYGQPGQPQVGSSLRTQAIVSLVIGAIFTVTCCAPTGIAAIVTSTLALQRLQTRPDSARTLVRWSWGLLIATVVLAVLVVGGLFAFGVVGSSTTTS